jgi:hypothetical protein
MMDQVAGTMQQTDWSGVAAVVGAVAGGIVTVGTFAMTVVNFIDNRRNAERREKKLDTVAHNVAKTATAVGVTPANHDAP